MCAYEKAVDCRKEFQPLSSVCWIDVSSHKHQPGSQLVLETMGAVLVLRLLLLTAYGKLEYGSLTQLSVDTIFSVRVEFRVLDRVKRAKRNSTPIDDNNTEESMRVREREREATGKTCLAKFAV